MLRQPKKDKIVVVLNHGMIGGVYTTEHQLDAELIDCDDWGRVGFTPDDIAQHIRLETQGMKEVFHK